MSKLNRKKGSLLIIVAVLSLLAGLLSAAFYSTVVSYHQAAAESFDRELSLWAADSGVAYYLGQFMGDSNYFNSNPAPQAAMQLNGSSFTLESAEEGSVSTQWNIIVSGTYGRATYRLGAAIGNGFVEIPDGIVVTGSNSPASAVLGITGATTIASYNSDDGAYNPSSPGSNANIAIDGSLSIGSGGSIHGDVSATGTLTSGLASYVTGDLNQNAPDPTVEDIDPIVSNQLNASKTSNNNSVLSGILGSNWTAVSGSQNYGDLIVGSGSYVIPAGTYRFRRFEVKNGGKVTFNTTGGPVNLIYVGSGAGTGALNDLTVNNGGIVEINNGSTSNGLLTVLGPDCDFKVTTNSIFGRSTTDAGNSGYSQIISLGGNSSSDDIMATGNSQVFGRVYAAAHTLTLSGTSKWYGSALVRTASIADSLFAVDEGSIGKKLADPTTFSVLARWKAGS